jgi:hypothetical protein
MARDREIRIHEALTHLQQGALLVKLSSGHYVVGLGKIPDEMAAAILQRDDIQPSTDPYFSWGRSPSWHMTSTTQREIEQ